jgi:hypothetical protein
MTSTTSTTNTNTNEAQKNEGTNMNNEVKAQASEVSAEATEAVRNSSDLSQFQRVVDKVLKDFKADNQELEMIVSMVGVHDVLSKDNLAHLIKGDKLLYDPAKRKNAAANSKAKPTSANQQRGVLLAMLPHYADLVKQSAAAILSNTAQMTVKQKEIEKSRGKKLNDKQVLALFSKVTTATHAKNAGKSEAELKIDAIEKMFARAIAKLYYLRRVQAEDVTLNDKTKTITFTGFDFEVNSDGGKTKVKLFSTKGEYTRTLAELKRDSNTFLKADGVTSVRSNGKGASNTNATTATATAEMNPIDTATNNSKAMSGMIKSLLKTKNAEQLASFKKAAAPKQLFDDMIAALFIKNGALDVATLQKAMDVAVAKAKIGGKVTVKYTEPTKDSVKQSA